MNKTPEILLVPHYWEQAKAELMNRPWDSKLVREMLTLRKELKGITPVITREG